MSAFILGVAALYVLKLAVYGQKVVCQAPDMEEDTSLDPVVGRPPSLGGLGASTGERQERVTTLENALRTRENALRTPGNTF